MALDSQVAEEMFNEEDSIITGSPDLVHLVRSRSSSGSDPMHGFPSPDIAASIVAGSDHKQVVESVQEQVNEYVKRPHESPTDEGSKKMMKRNHPLIGSSIWIENLTGKEKFKVSSSYSALAILFI